MFSTSTRWFLNAFKYYTYFLPFVHLRCESTNSLWFEAWYLGYHHVRGVDLGSWLLHVRMLRHAKICQSNQHLDYYMDIFVCTKNIYTDYTVVSVVMYYIPDQVTFACSNTLGMMWEVLASIVSLARCNDAGRMLTVLTFSKIGPLNFSTSNQSLKRCFPLPPKNTICCCTCDFCMLPF